ncbi:unnamed protein product, partial [Laminaria digitata]
MFEPAIHSGFARPPQPKNLVLMRIFMNTLGTQQQPPRLLRIIPGHRATATYYAIARHSHTPHHGGGGHLHGAGIKTTRMNERVVVLTMFCCCRHYQTRQVLQTNHTITIRPSCWDDLHPELRTTIMMGEGCTSTIHNYRSYMNMDVVQAPPLSRENRVTRTKSGEKRTGNYVFWCPSLVLITMFPRNNSRGCLVAAIYCCHPSTIRHAHRSTAGYAS